MKHLRHRVFDYLNNNRKQLLLVFAALLSLFIFFNEVKAVIVVTLLALLGAFGQVYKRVVRVTSAVEFVTFGTVIVAAAYGPVAGMLFAAAVSLAAEIISGGIDSFILIYWPVRILSGLFAALLPFESIVTTGIFTTGFINALVQPFYLLNSDSEAKINGIIYFVVNVAFNLLLFRLLGNLVLGFAS